MSVGAERRRDDARRVTSECAARRRRLRRAVWLSHSDFARAASVRYPILLSVPHHHRYIMSAPPEMDVGANERPIVAAWPLPEEEQETWTEKAVRKFKQNPGVVLGAWGVHPVVDRAHQCLQGV